MTEKYYLIVNITVDHLQKSEIIRLLCSKNLKKTDF